MSATHEPPSPRGATRRRATAARGEASALVGAIYARRFHDVDRLSRRRETLGLCELAALGDQDGVRARLADGEDPDAHDPSGWGPLHHAAALGCALAVAELVAGGARVDLRSRTERSYEGCTALHLSVAGGHSAVVDALLAAGADPSARDDAGYAPLHLAAELGHLGIVKRLLRAGARVNPFVGDETPLGLALRHRRMQIAALLRQCGATT